MHNVRVEQQDRRQHAAMSNNKSAAGRNEKYPKYSDRCTPSQWASFVLEGLVGRQDTKN